jgi:site-specific DNA-methyltransferase (adenine-specific)
MSAIELHTGDSRVVLPTLEPDCFDACVTDAPYHLTSIIKRFAATSANDDTQTSQRVRDRSDGYAALAAGFLGKTWDGGDIALTPDIWRAVFRVLKPGAHLVVFGGTRTYHRMACAVEDAGFEIRDCINWLYGSGFPKSHSVSQNIEKKNRTGLERRNGRKLGLTRHRWSGDTEGKLIASTGGKLELTSAEALAWDGWGTALKPACELIVLARKPMSEDTVAANVLRWGVGALNIDACRVDGGDALERWPANIAHDGSDEVGAAFGGDAIARFFYSAKADSDDRIGSDHPTVKPVELMQWLIRLVTPRGGLVLDPFAGTGTTGEAAFREGCGSVLIEREPDYQDDIRRRVRLLMAGPTERAVESIKHKHRGKPPDLGPLFAGLTTEVER